MARTLLEFIWVLRFHGDRYTTGHLLVRFTKFVANLFCNLLKNTGQNVTQHTSFVRISLSISQSRMPFLQKTIHYKWCWQKWLFPMFNFQPSKSGRVSGYIPLALLSVSNLITQAMCDAMFWSVCRNTLRIVGMSFRIKAKNEKNKKM